ncbi:MAG: hypothetical protein RIA10_13165 [Amphiplicatus sp.]
MRKATMMAAGLLAAACSGGDLGAAATQPAAALPQGTVMMRKVEVMDPSGFARPMVAATALIPAGWRAEGGIVWGSFGQCGGDYANRWSMTSPDGASALYVMPVPNWTGVRSVYPTGQQPQDSCEKAFYSSAREYLEATARRLHPQGRILDYRPLPDEAKPIQDVIAQFPPINDQNMQSRIFADAGEVLVAYQENGRDVRETISALVVITQARFADMMNPGQVAMEMTSGFPGSLTIVKAPNGALDLNLRKRVQSSVRFTPEWSAEIARFQARKNKIVSDGMTAAHEARMDAIKKTGEVMSGIYKQNDLASDRNQREFIEYVRGVETYDDPVYGGPVQLDNTYDHAWRVNNNDAYILTNDPNFNPGQYNIDARQLKVTQ